MRLVIDIAHARAKYLLALSVNYWLTVNVQFMLERVN